MPLDSQQTLVIMIPLAYLAGSIPFGLVVGLARGIDVRKAGSGNIGATNVGRLLGKKFFFLVFLLDMFKGLLPMLIASRLIRGEADASHYALLLAVAVAAIFGHMYSVFLKFKGGKGVATSAGIVLGVWPFFTLPAIASLGLFVLVLHTTRYMSIASIAAAVSFPVAYSTVAILRHWDPLGRQFPLLLFSVLMAVMIVMKHRTNIARLRAGTESRLTAKNTSAENAEDETRRREVPRNSTTE